MDGENNGTPYEQMDDLGCKNPYFWFNTHSSFWQSIWNLHRRGIPKTVFWVCGSLPISAAGILNTPEKRLQYGKINDMATHWLAVKKHKNKIYLCSKYFPQSIQPHM